MTKIAFARNAAFWIAFTGLLTLVHPAQAQTQYYYCEAIYSLPGQSNMTHFYASIFETSADHAVIEQAWFSHLKTKYGGNPGGTCTSGTRVSLEAALKSAIQRFPMMRSVRSDWKYTADQNVTAPTSTSGRAPAVTAGDTISNGNTITVKGFIYCYSVQEGGMNTYFSDVFPVELPATQLGIGPVPDNASVHRIQEAFYSYLKQKGYAFKSLGASNCEFRTDEQSAKALEHRRAYEGSPCSNCGKTVETGWTPTGISVVPSSGGASNPARPPSSTEPLRSNTKPASTSRRPDISGTYTGAYRCAQGSVHLKLTLMGSQQGALTGQFTFDLSPTGGARTATYSLRGTYDEAGKFRLDPVKWDSPEPSGYVMVGMEGAFDIATQQVSGKITNPTCSTFEATRKKP